MVNTGASFTALQELFKGIFRPDLHFPCAVDIESLGDIYIGMPQPGGYLFHGYPSREKHGSVSVAEAMTV